MKTISEDYVSFEIAKLLKNKGFDEETAYVYSNNGELLRLSHLGIKDLANSDCNGYHTWQFPIEGVASIISAPTLHMAMKWLREVHNIHIELNWDKGNQLYSFQIWKPGKYQPEISSLDLWRIYKDYNYPGEWDYEEACEVAIKYCLENLI